MFNIFKAVGDRLLGDVKNFFIDKGKKAAKQVLDMAKALDLDNNGVKDFAQVQQDLARITVVVRNVLTALRALGAPLAAVLAAAKEGIQPVADLIKLGGLYYAKFGLKKPSETVAHLEQKKSEAHIVALLDQAQANNVA